MRPRHTLAAATILAAVTLGSWAALATDHKPAPQAAPEAAPIAATPAAPTASKPRAPGHQAQLDRDR